jgi:hypothetical protein
MLLPVFLSYPKPFEPHQERLVGGVLASLRERGLEPRTLGVDEYDNEVPLAAVRRLLIESNGILTLALRRHRVEQGATKPESDAERRIDGAWFTSAWPHMETAMGFQLGLPIMVVREKDVLADGVLDPGVVGKFVIPVDASKSAEFLLSRQWRDPLAAWERDVRTVAKNRGMPPKLF